MKNTKDSQRKTNRANSKHKPAQCLNVSTLISKIYQFDLLEWQGKLNGDGRQQRKLLMDRYNAIRTARQRQGLETSELVPFDPEAHEFNLKQQKRVKVDDNVIESRSSLPSLPSNEDIPSADILEALGLPSYRSFV